MKRSILIIIVILAAVPGTAPAFPGLPKIDTTHKTDTWYYEEYTCETFDSAGIGNQLLDIKNIDPDLLNAAVFFRLNKLRKRRRRAPVAFSPQLHILAYNYVTQKHRRKFANLRKNRKYFKKNLLKYTKSVNFKGRLADIAITREYALNYRRHHPFYYDYRETKNYYYGKKPGTKDSTVEKIPVPCYTYNELADEIIMSLYRSSSNTTLRSGAYEYAGCFVQVDPGTLNRKKIPVVKVMIVFGGFRNRLVNEMLAGE